MCDLTKAFDCVDPVVLLVKMEHYGIRGNSLSLFKSYLTNRMQYVSLNNNSSEHLPISYAVPQGSVLVPLLFLLYINDLPAALNGLSCVLFANDATILT